MGADFLYHFNLLVNCRQRVLSNATSQEKTIGKSFQTNSINHTSDNPKEISASIVPNISMRILTNGMPIAQRSRKLFGEKLNSAKSEFNKLIEQGILRASKSSWASPLTMVRKADGSWRPCGDYRMLNNATEPDKYPLPRIHDLIDHISQPSIFSKLDLQQAYHQIPIASEDCHKTAIITPFGLFEYTHMPFGLKNSSQTFQRYMDQILRGTESFCINYVDDILIFSNNKSEHEKQVNLILHKLSSAGLRINKEKCLFSVDEVEFLGFQFSAKGIQPKEERVKAIDSMKPPSDVRQLQRFIGMINYYHWMIPDLSRDIGPLHDLVTKSTKSKKNFKWEKVHEDSFTLLKKKLTSGTIISYVDPTRTFVLCSDASSTAIGASLGQINTENQINPVGFFSRKLNTAEKKYSTFDRELLAIYLSVKHFKHYLDGTSFIIRTDHKPLLQMTSMKETSARQWRHIECLSQYSFKLEYICGRDNIVADLLSRPEEESGYINAITIKDLIDEQNTDPTIKNLRDSSLIISTSAEGIQVDTSYETTRIILPQRFRKSEFERLHSMSHPSAKPSIQLIRSRYVWPRMKSDIRKWCRECLKCQKSKITRHTKAPYGLIQTLGRFKTIHMDLVGPLPKIGNKSYILTIIDRATSWVEAIPISEITSTAIIKQLDDHWVCRFGPPEVIVTDQGLQFDSEQFKTYCASIGTKHIRTTAYHPQSNGKVERWHRSLKNSIRAHSDNPSKTWIRDLPRLLLSLRNCTTTDGKASPTELTFGFQTRLPGDLTIPHLNDSINECDEINSKELEETISYREGIGSIRPNKIKPFVSKNLVTCEEVWVRNENKRSLEDPYHGPYKVVQRSSDMKTFEVNLNGLTKRISIDRLKPVIRSSTTNDIPLQGLQGESC